MMKYTALALLFVFACTVIGARGAPRIARLPFAAGLAVAMVTAQLAVLLLR